VSFAELPGWAEDDHATAFATFLNSCQQGAVAETATGVLPCAEALAMGAEIGGDAARRFFESRFTPDCSSPSPGFVTGYYEPEVEGSRTRQGRFQIPVYNLPGDLVQATPGLIRARFNHRVTGTRASEAGDVPYFTRAEIDAGALEGKGLEILYLDDPVELFYMQVQGSGRVRLRDGTTVRLSYAGRNGHPYRSIGRLLVERGEIALEDMSMAAVKAWLRADQARGRQLMQENRSYVFFRELTEDEGRDGPLGAQGVPLTPGRSLAVDAALVPLGCPIFMVAPNLADAGGAPFLRLMIAQDVGSAIRGPARGDIFWGTGEEAGAIAGTTRHEASFFVLLPKR
jgi:membrane-bound lytic murein transglycosylase A